MAHVLCTGGGSAGHVIPLTPVIDALLAAGHDVSFIGSKSGLEADLLAGMPIAYHGISVGKLRRYPSVQNGLDVFRVIAGIVQAWGLLRDIRPDVVCSKGGYVSVPVVVAAWLLRIPVLAHESDLTPGLANRLAMKVASTVCVSFAETTLSGFGGRVQHTGSPVRAELLRGNAAAGRAQLGVQSLPILVITGGSLGAAKLNALVEAALPRLVERYYVVHVTGVGKGNVFDHARYRQFEYVADGWGDLLAAADLVVTRAGATTLFELLALAKPNLLIPLPADQSRGDQLENAALAESKGFSLVRQEYSLDGDSFADAVDALANRSKEFRHRIEAFESPDAVQRIVEETLRLVRL